jgi:hypothetical protein
MVKATLISLTQISEDDSYNAFTDLTYLKGKYWVAFRSGKGHVSPHGQIAIYNSIDGNSWKEFSRISHDVTDLRDPHLAVIQGKLTVSAFSLDYSNPPSGKKYVTSDSYFYQLENDSTFELAGTFKFSENNAIIWSFIEHQNEIYVSAYGYPQDHSTLYVFKATSLQDPWTVVAAIPEEKLPSNAGYNEADILFDKDGTMVLFLRVGKTKIINKTKEKGKNIEYLSLVGRAKPPYKDWDISKYDMYLKGPKAIAYKNSYLVTGRFRKKFQLSGKRQINLYHYDGKFEHLLNLATGNDGSYAGLCWNPNDSSELLISFYSDHNRLKTKKQGKSNDIWIARVKIDD